MSLQERTYSVLLVSASSKFNDALSALMPESACDPIQTARDLSSAKRLCAEHVFDFVIINSPLPDDAGIRFSIDLCHESPASVLLLIPADVHEQIRDKVVSHGVFTLAKPVTRSILSRALDWMASARERMRKTEKKALSIEEKMEEIRLVNRAKWLLIRELGMEEPEAHRYIEKEAMNRSLTKREIAKQIIQTY